MRQNLNKENIEGRVFDHSLKIKTVKNTASENYGKEFIQGDVDIATDEAGLNVITVSYTYVTEITKKGTKNGTFAALKRIIDTDKTWVKVGKDEAIKVKAATRLGLNDFYNRDDQLVSIKINDGGFLNIVNELNENENERNTFEVDMVITGTTRVEADPEKNIDNDYMAIKGAVFDSRNALLPVELTLSNSAGMNYFESLEISGTKPVYTTVCGNIISLNKKTTVTEESAWGEPFVKTVTRKEKRWEITRAKPEPFEFGTPEVMTVEELTKATQDRAVFLAERKKNHDEYVAQRNAGGATIPAGAGAAPKAPVTPNNIPGGGFTF